MAAQTAKKTGSDSKSARGAASGSVASTPAAAAGRGRQQGSARRIARNTPQTIVGSMSRLAGGALGLAGFSLAVFSGLSAGNGAAEILENALLISVGLAAVGALAGALIGSVIRERLESQAGATSPKDGGGPQDEVGELAGGSKSPNPQERAWIAEKSRE